MGIPIGSVVRITDIFLSVQWKVLNGAVQLNIKIKPFIYIYIYINGPRWKNLHLNSICCSQQSSVFRLDGCPIKGNPEHDSAVMYGVIEKGPQLFPHDAERRQSLGHLIAVVFPVCAEQRVFVAHYYYVQIFIKRNVRNVFYT